MNQDLVERLRTKSVVRWIHNPGATPEMRGHKPDPDCQEAAAEIERLRALVARQPLTDEQIDAVTIPMMGVDINGTPYFIGYAVGVRKIARAIEAALGVRP